jgi:hypothetical protein
MTHTHTLLERNSWTRSCSDFVFLGCLVVGFSDFELSDFLDFGIYDLCCFRFWDFRFLDVACTPVPGVSTCKAMRNHIIFLCHSTWLRCLQNFLVLLMLFVKHLLIHLSGAPVALAISSAGCSSAEHAAFCDVLLHFCHDRICLWRICLWRFCGAAT